MTTKLTVINIAKSNTDSGSEIYIFQDISKNTFGIAETLDSLWEYLVDKYSDKFMVFNYDELDSQDF